MFVCVAAGWGGGGGGGSGVGSSAGGGGAASYSKKCIKNGSATRVVSPNSNGNKKSTAKNGGASNTTHSNSKSKSNNNNKSMWKSDDADMDDEEMLMQMMESAMDSQFKWIGTAAAVVAASASASSSTHQFMLQPRAPGRSEVDQMFQEAWEEESMTVHMGNGAKMTRKFHQGSSPSAASNIIDQAFGHDSSSNDTFSNDPFESLFSNNGRSSSSSSSSLWDSNGEFHHYESFVGSPSMSSMNYNSNSNSNNKDYNYYGEDQVEHLYASPAGAGAGAGDEFDFELMAENQVLSLLKRDLNFQHYFGTKNIHLDNKMCNIHSSSSSKNNNNMATVMEQSFTFHGKQNRRGMCTFQVRVHKSSSATTSAASQRQQQQQQQQRRTSATSSSRQQQQRRFYHQQESVDYHAPAAVRFEVFSILVENAVGDRWNVAIDNRNEFVRSNGDVEEDVSSMMDGEDVIFTEVEHDGRIDDHHHHHHHHHFDREYEGGARCYMVECSDDVKKQ